MHRKTLKTGASGVTSLPSPQSFSLLLPIIGMHSCEWICPFFACISLAYQQFVDNFSSVSLKTGASFIWHYLHLCNRTRFLCIYCISGILMLDIQITFTTVFSEDRGFRVFHCLSILLYWQWCNCTRSLCIYCISGILMWGVNKIAYLLARLKIDYLVTVADERPSFCRFCGHCIHSCLVSLVCQKI